MRVNVKNSTSGMQFFWDAVFDLSCKGRPCFLTKNFCQYFSTYRKAIRLELLDGDFLRLPVVTENPVHDVYSLKFNQNIISP